RQHARTENEALGLEPRASHSHHSHLEEVFISLGNSPDHELHIGSKMVMSCLLKHSTHVHDSARSPNSRTNRPRTPPASIRRWASAARSLGSISATRKVSTPSSTCCRRVSSLACSPS